jgi:hypothetical protein
MALKSKSLESVRADVPIEEVSKESVARVNILVPASVQKSWKGVAVEADMTLTQLITEAMNARLRQMSI